MKSRALFLCILAAGSFFVGCNVLTPPTPTPTPAPTETPTPVPTATAAPTRPRPSATPANALPPAIAFALNKTQSANSMEFEFESAVTMVQGGQTKTIPGLALKGFDSTLNRDVLISGTTSDTNEFISYQVVVVGEDVFIKGLGGNGLDEKQWYQLPQEMQAGVRRLPTARGLISSFSPEDVGKAEFQAAGNETLDDENCSVWSAQNPTFARTLIGVSEESDLRKQLGEIDGAEFQLWTCADGYIHQMKGNVRGHSAQNTADTVTVTLNFQMKDFNVARKIEAPTGVKPFPVPTSSQPPSVPTQATDSTPSTSPTASTPSASPTQTQSASPSPTP